MTETIEFQEGQQAFKDGLGVDENPYSEFTEAHEEWEGGWYEEWGERFSKDWQPDWFVNR